MNKSKKELTKQIDKLKTEHGKETKNLCDEKRKLEVNFD